MAHPEAPLDYNDDGWTEVHAFRLRPSWFGFLVAQQKWLHRDGRAEWRRMSRYRAIEIIVRFEFPC